MLELRFAVESLASYASDVGASLDAYLIDEAVVELGDAFQILKGVASVACIGGRRNTGAFAVIATAAQLVIGDGAIPHLFVRLAVPRVGGISRTKRQRALI
jgi:hypothetical protein